MSTRKSKRQKHDYTSELELKSLLIRIKNKKNISISEKYNKRINKYIRWHTSLNNKKYKSQEHTKKKNTVKTRVKEKIIELSESTTIDHNSYERFGEIILLMISRILTKPQFSGYTYRDDFFSDSVHKIIKYNHNFNHKMISPTTGQPVNSFSYISQIIHNSILYIIESKKKEQQKIKQQISTSILDHNYAMKDHTKVNQSTYDEEEHKVLKEEVIHIKEFKDGETLSDFLINLNVDDFDYVKIYYPKNYTISFEEYDIIKDNLRGKISVMKEKS